MNDYTGRTVVLTGTSGALGAGLAAAFTDAGAQVVGVDRAVPEARVTVDGARYETADLTDDAQVGALFDAIGAPWAVVHTVGGFAPPTALATLNPDELVRQLRPSSTAPRCQCDRGSAMTTRLLVSLDGVVDSPSNGRARTSPRTSGR
jgi:NAD(P)-dependent dehydrogenase (short-subunit alcohol dehydrogenase family)